VPEKQRVSVISPPWNGCASSRLPLGWDQFFRCGIATKCSTGDRLGPFEILNAIGAGGMGESTSMMRVTSA
jgi:hypothetical protein